MASRGRLEAQIYQSSNWTADVVGTNTATATIAASSSRYPTDLCTAVAAAFSTATGDTITVTPSFGESGTGKITIATNGPTLTVSWTSVELGLLLGFTAGLVLATSYTSPFPARGLWMPDSPHAACYGPNDPGHTKSDRRASMSPRGDIWAVKYSSRVVLPYIRWSHIGKTRARVASETLAGQSFEQWWRWTHNGELSYFAVAPKVKLVWDADVSATYHEYRLSEGDSSEMPKVVEDWNGLYTIELRNLIQVP